MTVALRELIHSYNREKRRSRPRIGDVCAIAVAVATTKIPVVSAVDILKVVSGPLCVLHNQ